MNPFPLPSRGADLFDQIYPSGRFPPLICQSRNHNSPVIESLREMRLDDLFPKPIKNPQMARGAHAGLFLLSSGWEESHQMAQELDTLEGWYWHGLVHRCEPDWSNARYWFRRVGQHPVYKKLNLDFLSRLSGEHQELEGKGNPDRWDPFLFIDLCQMCETKRLEGWRQDLEVVQFQEMRALLQYCVTQALSPSSDCQQ